MTETADVKDGTGESAAVTAAERTAIRPGSDPLWVISPCCHMPMHVMDTCPRCGKGADLAAELIHRHEMLVMANELIDRAASAALLSLAAALDRKAGGPVRDLYHAGLGAAAEMARLRAHPSATSPPTVSRAPGGSPGGTGPQNPAQGHEYLSTSCLHGGPDLLDPLHGYCQSPTGSNGDTDWVKAPAVCKFCPAPCVCPCHRARTGSDRREAGDG